MIDATLIHTHTMFHLFSLARFVYSIFNFNFYFPHLIHSPFLSYRSLFIRHHSHNNVVVVYFLLSFLECVDTRLQVYLFVWVLFSISTKSTSSKDIYKYNIYSNEWKCSLKQAILSLLSFSSNTQFHHSFFCFLIPWKNVSFGFSYFQVE